ncbi:hypothetical protein M405DRAFT_729715, partial [Rhizopogon salebrosus TDB-379]
CPHCPTREETVHHLLLECPHYRRERHQLGRALGRKTTSIPYLLTDPEATTHLVRYINSTRRLKGIFGEVPLPTTRQN